MLLASTFASACAMSWAWHWAWVLASSAITSVRGVAPAIGVRLAGEEGSALPAGEEREVLSYWRSHHVNIISPTEWHGTQPKDMCACLSGPYMRDVLGPHLLQSPPQPMNRCSVDAELALLWAFFRLLSPWHQLLHS